MNPIIDINIRGAIAQIQAEEDAKIYEVLRKLWYCPVCKEATEDRLKHLTDNPDELHIILEVHE